MLSFEVAMKSGEIRRDLRVLTASWKSELDVPADSLAVSCVYDGEIFENADRLSAFDGDALIFEGQIDELSRISSDKGTALKLSARSAAAALLDNEAEPLTYRNPTAALMYYKHLKPFGFTDVELDQAPVIGCFRIDKGMSQWQVLDSFCRTKYGFGLRISGSGKVYMRGYKNDKTVRFGGSGIKYYSIKENKCRYKLISEVKLKVSDRAGYLSAMINPNPECENIRRIRYVNAIAENNSLETADNILEKSNRDSRYIKISFGGCRTDILGAAATVEDPDLGVMSGLTVRKINYTLGKNGEQTAVVLGAAEGEEIC